MSVYHLQSLAQQHNSNTPHIPSPGIQEDKFEIETGSEHEHVAVEFDLGDGGAGQGVAHGHQPHVLVTALEGRHVHGVLADLQVPAAVDHLWGQCSTLDMAAGAMLNIRNASIVAMFNISNNSSRGNA